ncbi:dexamethasone-induced Ras-related protein 1 [Lates japonicus]|uniref:Dexamethasone-induced Ras-related protein 1 n=1 Tax=Lates japonicus TaxID=270547 RepID=A0AAD3QYF8_LATJO|nr:dexamethasone-induced Ras-related protein 1 [Lates japonicus]
MRPSPAYETKTKENGRPAGHLQATSVTGTFIEAGGLDEQLVGGDHCAYFEISKRRRTPTTKMFQSLFTMAKLPNEMSPDWHCKVSCSTARFSTETFRNKKCKTERCMGLWHRLRGDQAHSD